LGPQNTSVLARKITPPSRAASAAEGPLCFHLGFRRVSCSSERPGSGWTGRAGDPGNLGNLTCPRNLRAQKIRAPPYGFPGKTMVLGRMSDILFFLKLVRPNAQTIEPGCQKVAKIALFPAPYLHLRLTGAIWSGPPLNVQKSGKSVVFWQLSSRRAGSAPPRGGPWLKKSPRLGVAKNMLFWGKA
jgi:hypothetical protein